MAHAEQEQRLSEPLVEQARKDRDFFGRGGKQERERVAVSEFLSFLSLDFNESELVSQEERSKVDVQFREACIQVKELMDSDYPRTRIYKERYENLEAFPVRKHEPIAYCTPAPSQQYQLVLDLMPKLGEKYKNHNMNELDLLIYSTRTRASLIEEYQIRNNDFENLGWRSVLFASGAQAVILYLSSNSPAFLHQKKARVFMREKRGD